MQLTTKIRVFALTVSTTPLWSQPTINGVTVSATQACAFSPLYCVWWEYYPRAIDLKTNCWRSEVNLSVPCAFKGPTQAMEATQVYVAGAVTAPNIRQRWLSSLLMGREQSICLFQSVADVGRMEFAYDECGPDG